MHDRATKQRDCDTMGPATSQNVGVPMRQECKNFESRTYANGETVQKCNVDLAPDAPWRCPDQCAGYERRIIDGGWTYGSLTPPSTPKEPPGLDDGTAAAVLDEAEEIINAIVPEVLAEVLAENQRKKGFGRFFRRRGRS
ncbi:MAG: hypothetical protein WCH93_00435 [Actinomycetota bacterium]